MEQRLFCKDIIHEYDTCTTWPCQIYRKKTIARMFDVCAATIDRWVAEGVLPKPLRFNVAQRSIGWSRDDIAELFNKMERVA